MRPLFQFSRSIYRSLAGDVVPSSNRAHERALLEACESAMHRLATDRRYFARPAQRLFGDIRHCFPLSEHERVLHVVTAHVAAAESYLDRVPTGSDGAPHRCPATTRGGTPCRRDPLRGNGYCPSHQHLAGTHGHQPMAA
jgi:hypothetical protein